MNDIKKIQNCFDASIKVKQQAADLLASDIAQTAQQIWNTVNNNNKLLICGNGGSAADAQHFAAEMQVRYVAERKALPAISLATDGSSMTAICNDYGHEKMFSRQVEALGNKGDILFAISTSGNSENISQAINSAAKLGMQIIFLTGNSGGYIIKYLKQQDISLVAPSDVTARVQEVHGLVIHAICELIDKYATEQ